MRRLFTLFAVLISIHCGATIAIMGGASAISGSTAGPVLINSVDLYTSIATLDPISGTPTGQILAIGVDSQGNAILGGSNPSNEPIIYRLPFGSNTPVAIGVPGGAMPSIYGIVIDSNDTAILVGEDDQTSPSVPIVYTLGSTDLTVTQLTLPSPVHGYLNAVAIGPNGTAIAAGGNTGTNVPLIYSLEEGSSTLNFILNPNGDTGSVNCVAIGPDNRAILGGDYVSLAPLIYSVAEGASMATLISTPGGAMGTLICDAVGSDGTAILAGQSGSDVPLIYHLTSGDSSVTLITNPNSDMGIINCVAITSADEAILGGQDQTSNQSIVYTLPSGATTALAIETPDPEGSIYGIAIDSSNTAVLVGENFYTDDALIYTLSGSTLSSISGVSEEAFSNFNAVGTYPSSPPQGQGLYDLNRLRSIYNEEVLEANAALRDAGL